MLMAVKMRKTRGAAGNEVANMVIYPNCMARSVYSSMSDFCYSLMVVDSTDSRSASYCASVSFLAT